MFCQGLGFLQEWISEDQGYGKFLQDVEIAFEGFLRVEFKFAVRPTDAPFPSLNLCLASPCVEIGICNVEASRRLMKFPPAQESCRPLNLMFPRITGRSFRMLKFRSGSKPLSA